jgi:hypothetical protein
MCMELYVLPNGRLFASTDWLVIWTAIVFELVLAFLHGCITILICLLWVHGFYMTLKG